MSEKYSREWWASLQQTPGLTQTDREIIADLSGYGRDATPDFRQLSDNARQLVHTHISDGVAVESLIKETGIQDPENQKFLRNSALPGWLL